MKITRKTKQSDGKLHEYISFDFPFWSPRSNPYMGDEYCGEYPTLTGCIWTEKWGTEMAFSATIDMDYKGKADQVGGPLVHWYGSEEDFIKKCNELGLEVYDMREPTL
jgi:hypothetical protein